MTKELVLEHVLSPGNDIELAKNSKVPWDYDLINAIKDNCHWPYLTLSATIPWTEKMFVDFNIFDENIRYINGPNLWTGGIGVRPDRREGW